MENKKLLQFNVAVVKFINLWPNKNGVTHGLRRTLNDFFLVFFVTPSFICVLLGLYFQFFDEDIDLSSVAESLISITCCIGLFYVVVCFVKNRDLIMRLIDELNDFKEFANPPDLLRTDKNASMFTLFFLIYGIVGTLVYASVPFISYEECSKNKSNYMKKIGVPCGLVVTKFYLPFRFDYTPLKEMVTGYQVLICIVFSNTISILTMLLCGMLMHINTQLRHLGNILENGLNKDSDIAEDIRNCVKYHHRIILYATNTKEAFSSMMLLHITVTSFVISILGYQVLLNTNYTDSLRYLLHLGGWLVLLFLVCYNGQSIMDQSSAIAKNAYSSPWYKFPPKVRQDIVLIIVRSQRPLTLNALNFGVMSLETFLQVMSTAYSYFTLLVKMRS